MVRPTCWYKSSGVPILRNSDIDRDAEAIIREFNPELLEKPQEIDVDELAEFYFGLSIDIEYLTHCGLILGRMVFQDTERIPYYVPSRNCADYVSVPGKTIMLDVSLTYPANTHLYRSTVLHECGHYFYHRPYFEYKRHIVSDDTADSITYSDGKRKQLVTDNDWLEHHAQYFSSALSVPASALKIYMDNPDVILGYKGCCSSAGINAYLIRAVSHRFNVSRQTAAIRLSQFGYLEKRPSYAMSSEYETIPPYREPKLGGYSQALRDKWDREYLKTHPDAAKLFSKKY